MRLAAVDLNPRGTTILNTQRKAGAVDGYTTVAYNNAAIVSDGSGGLMQLLYTPPVPAWWVVEALVGIIYKADANYNYLYTYLSLTPADLDGATAAFQLGMQHSTVQTYECRHVRRAWRLAPGVAYTCGLILGGGNGGTWQYNTNPNILWMEAEAWAQ